MIYWDFFLASVKSLLARRKRSWLTMIGIFIGVATIVSLLAVGEGMESAINEIFAKMGSDKIMVMAGSGIPLESGSPLLQSDLEVVRTVKGVKYATGMITKVAPVKFHDEVKYNFVIGVPTDADSIKVISDMQQLRIIEGRNLKAGDGFKALVCYLYGVDIFTKKVGTGQRLTVNGHDFDVVGRMDRIGAKEKDSQVIIPLDTFREIFGEPEKLLAIVAQAQTGASVPAVAAEIKRALRRQRDEREGEETFQVQTSEEIRKTAGTVLSIVQAFLIGVAFISLLVGGIGIMNTMYTSVLERTKEIGIMKAVGARNSHIMALFLIEAGILGSLGGAIGVALGYALSKGVEYMASTQLSTTLIQAKISPGLILGALAFSFIVGCLSGVLPARAAAQQNPVDALHYE